MSLKEIRRQNLRTLARSVGGVSALAKLLGRQQSQLSHVISEHPCKNIGDRLANYIEQVCNKPSGWLDTNHNPEEKFYSYVPLISWLQINTFITTTEKAPIKKEILVPIKTNYSPKSFALQVIQNNMQCEQGMSFIKGSIIIVDPEYAYQNNSFVIANVPDHEAPVFRQLIMENNKYILKSLNKNTARIETLPPAVKIHGVVRCMFMELI